MKLSRQIALAGLAAALTAQACGSCGAPHRESSPEPGAPVARAGGSFTDVTHQAGISFRHFSGASGRKYLPETMGSGVAVLDYDGDGRPDLYFVNGTGWPDAPAGPKRRGGAGAEAARPLPALYRNMGNGTFMDRTAEAGLAASFYGMGAAAADYDNDGDTDLFVTALGPNRLYRNDGGHFTEISRQAGVADPGFGTSVAFLDYDHDGDLDLFVCNYVEWTIETDLFCTFDGQTKSYCTPESYRGQSSRLYRNDGSDHFTDVTKQAGVFNPSGKSLGVTTLDYDGDGWEDIVVANDTQPNYLYHNNRNGTFTDVGRESGIAFSESGMARGAMGIDSADYDRSGRDSLVIGNFSNEMVGLYHNEGSGIFIDDAPRAGVGLPSLLTLAFGCFFFDYDLDGYFDIFVANGHVEDDINRVQKDITYAQAPHLFHNRGDGTFEPVPGDANRPDDPLRREVVARGAAYLDYDADGDLDVVMTTNNGPAYLLRNDTALGRSWVRVKLIGSKANRDGIGARIRVTAGDRTVSAMMKAGASYCSQSELVGTFGLGSAKAVDRIEVVWPGGGKQLVDKPAIGTTVAIRQDQDAPAAASGQMPAPR